MHARFLALALASVSFLAAPAARADWPQFRGPRGDGIAAAGDAKPAGLPVEWSETQNVKWKTPIPHRGWSSPVVLEGRIWLTTATPDGKDMFAICVDAATGEVKLNQKLIHNEAPEPLGNGVNCYGSPTPAVDPGRVYIHFGSYITACLEAATGKVLWERRDLPCRHYRGPGSSVLLFENLLILTMDGVDVQYLVALDKKTGQTVWKTDRTADWKDTDAQGKPAANGDFRKAYSTPLIVESGGRPLMLSSGAKAAYGYDPKTGKELWKVGHTGYSAAARPVFWNGLAFFTTGFGRAEMFAVRVDGSGDVSNTHVAWRFNKGVPLKPSPILLGDLIYMVHDGGVATCVEAATGKEVWQQRLGGSFSASPIHADGRLYFFDEKGKAMVVKIGRTYEALATNTLGDGCMASPAVAGKSLIVRTKTHLYRIEAEEAGKK